MLVNLLNVPKNHLDWETFFWNNKTQIDEIRQAIQRSTGNITAIITTSNGSGYSSAPAVTITDAKGNGKGATALATYTVSGGFYNIAIAVITQGTGYLEPVVTLSGGGGTGATALAEYVPVTILTQYVMYPVNEQNKVDMGNFLENKQQSHEDFNSFLNLQSSDIEELDINNPQQLQAWIYLQYQELNSACEALKI